MHLHERLLDEAEYRRCRGTSPADVVALEYFLEQYAFIQHPERGSILIPLRAAQRQILATWTSERYSIVLKARQIGWSTLAALYALWLAFFWPDQQIIMLSKGEREAEKLLLKGTYAYDRMPQWMKARGPKRTTRNLKKLSFDNASVIESMPSKEDPGRSSTASLVFVDEWAFLDNPEEAWASIEPIADVGGRVIGLSTANGSGDFFHSMWLKAEQKLTDFVPMFFPWSANSDRNEEWYATKKRNLPAWQLAQEYPSNPDEAFIKSGNPVFDTDKLSSIAVSEPTEGWLQWHDGKVRSATFRTDTTGPISLWERPRAGHAYVIGADVAEGLAHGDYSSAHVIDVKTDAIVATWHGHIDADEFGVYLGAIAWWYNSALLGVEVNNHGLTTCKAIQRLGYPNLYYRKSLDDRQEKWLSKVGWATTQKSKPLMIDDLTATLREGDLRIPCAATISEMRAYVRDAKGRTHGSPHDDRVMSLAVANQMRAYQRVPHTTHRQDDYWTFNWFRNLLDAGNTDSPMGSFNVRSK